jgi:hypothetical protein
MNKRWWLGLLLITLLLLLPAQIATAQTSTRHIPPGFLHVPPKQSHHDLPGGLDLDNPQEMMAQRLRELHDLHELQDQVSGLLKDGEFLKSIGQLSEAELRGLREKMLSGEGLGKDGSWEQLLRQAASQNKLDPKQIDILRRWAKRAEDKQPSVSESGSPNDRSPDAPTPPSAAIPHAPTPPPSLPPANRSEPSWLDRMQEEGTKWLIDHLDDVGDDVLEALTDIGRTENGAPLAELLRTLHQPDFSGLNLSSRVEGLSRYMPKVGEFLHAQGGTWNEVRSLFRNAPVPSLPRFGGPSAPRPSAVPTDSEGWTPALLSMLMLGMIVLLFYRMGARSQARTDSSADQWRLGPWPVLPEAVSTRQDVVRAFEYLALLCLGPAAAACHHRELAERLAEQDSGNSKRRQAAEMLAWLYEQARYAPDGEVLSPEELIDARHALCCLAGGEF